MIIMMTIGISVTGTADVVIKSKTTMKSPVSFGQSETESIEYIRADKSRSESKMKLVGALSNLIPGGAEINSISIVRIDKNLIWNIIEENKTYHETDIKSYEANFVQESDDEESYDEMDDQESDDDDYEWTFDLKVSDKTEKINGYNCVLVTGTGTGINREDPSDTTTVIFRQWKTSDFPGLDEVNRFYAAYSDAAGSEGPPVTVGMEQALRGFGDEFAGFYEKAGKVDGFSIKTVIEISKNKLPEDESDNHEETDDSEMPSWMKKKMEKVMGKGESEKTADAPATIISVTSEVLSVDTKAVDNSKFEIPSGYNKK